MFSIFKPAFLPHQVVSLVSQYQLRPMCEKGGGCYKYRGRVMKINDQDGLQRYLKGVTSL